MRGISFLLFCLLPVFPVAAGRGDTSSDGRWALYWEIDQMFLLKAGAECHLSPRWAMKGGFGVSVSGFTTMGYEILGVYHISERHRRFQCDLEFGLPLAYFDALEDNVVDWNPDIDSPYAGWGPGLSLVWGYRFRNGGALGLKTGCIVVFEYRRDSGWREDLLVLPEISLQWIVSGVVLRGTEGGGGE